MRLRRYYNYCFCDRCVKAFLEKIPQAAAEVPESDRAKWILDNYPDEWAAFHAECITDLVRLIRKRIKDCRSDVQLSAAIWYNAPYGNELRQEPLEDESESRCFGQKWWEWVDEGLVDFLCPMDYWLLPETFRSVVSGQLKKVNGKVPLYIGLLKSREFEISVEQNKKYNIIASEAGASGICYFSYSTWK